MKEQTEKTTQVLKMALQMEIEGQEFYDKAGKRSDNPLAKKLFQHLVEQENVHIQKINEIYQDIKNSAGWPEKKSTFKHQMCLRDVFKEAIENIECEVKVSSSEIEALQTAMSMEDKSYSFYKCRDEEATSAAEKSFYQALTAEERDHYLTLLDSYEYLKDPEGWLTKTEHWGLDGA